MCSFNNLIKVTDRYFYGVAANAKEAPTVEEFKKVELSNLRSAQKDRCSGLRSGKQIPSSSCLITLAPELDGPLHLIYVISKLQHCRGLEADVLMLVYIATICVVMIICYLKYKVVI